MKSRTRYLIAILLVISLCSKASSHDDEKKKKGVTYDGTSLIINGKRELFFSGSVHYPRSTPDMWPSIIDKARIGGLNTIQTYVFWNVHEPEQGKYDFKGRFDLVKFIKLIHEKGLYVTLRLGPFIQAEWNHGGLPYWLREVPDVYFRTNNEPFKEHTERYVRKILGMMKEEKLFASQGGPIILGQIENEYNAVQLAYKENGEKYIKWAANLVESMNLGIPWVMCKQNDAPGNLINACNGRHCGDTFPGPNRHDKPSLWTENWTTQFRVFGDPPTQRTAEDIAFSVARYFSKNGSHVNYYMYHGGTNFGRTSAHFVTTRYYDDAPLDEFGLEKAPKYGHLKHVHRALRLCKKALFWGQLRAQTLGPDTEVRYYEQPGTKVCAAFLSNNNTRDTNTIKFKGQDYVLPSRSISILPDCKTVVYNTAQIVAQHSWRDFVKSEKTSKGLKFEMFSENIPSLLDGDSLIPGELYYLTKDKTDYACVKIDEDDFPDQKGLKTILRVASLGHALIVYVNGEYAGKAHGRHEMKSFEFAKPVNFKTGDNRISILGVLTGLPDSGSYMEHRFAGPRAISIIGLKSGTRDLTENNEWGHLAGLEGEKKEVYTEEGSKKVKWEKDGERKPLTWYKTYFETPEGVNAVAIRMKGMGKGLIWVNGIGVGRYWMSFLSPLGEPTQTEYHIPRSFMKGEKKKNMLVILEEEPGVKLESIDFVLVNRDTICSNVGEDYPVSVKSWKREGPKIVSRSKDMRLKAVMRCPPEKQMVEVQFASFGDPTGTCGNFTMGKCSASKSKEVVEKECLGRNYCSIVVARETFGDKGCPEIVKTLAVQVKCEKKEGKQDEKKKKEDKDEEEEDDEDDDEEEEEEDKENKDTKDMENKNQDILDSDSALVSDLGFGPFSTVVVNVPLIGGAAPPQPRFNLMPPSNYIAGLGRGAAGFTTRSDIGPARANGDGDADVNHKFDDFEGHDAGLFANAESDDQDKEADAIWDAIDRRMDSRRKDRREAKLKQEIENYRASNPKVSGQFVDLTRKLHTLSEDEWDSIPEIGNYSHRLY
ncbi:D-galactoside/L-rhamnose binding SUEL lectin domain [Arabidopsis thaliana x Arabidopsis arenosa]|nr:D-galactoside/L-rhamnose binding SUEL lectin domain [Arabidopsis thaliana x Arabidopsis arenosa]